MLRRCCPRPLRSFRPAARRPSSPFFCLLWATRLYAARPPRAKTSLRAEGAERAGRRETSVDVDLEPVDLEKLALPLHSMETIPPDVVSNVIAKDKTIVFSPHRKQRDVCRRLLRMKYRYSVQPLGRVLHFSFFVLKDALERNVRKDVTPEMFQKIKEMLRGHTRFVVTDERWPLEVSLEITPIMQRSSSELEREIDVARMLGRVLADEFCVGAWCGLSSTPILAKMACTAAQRKHPLKAKNVSSGNTLYTTQYDLPTHELLKKFVENLPVGDIPVVGPAQVRLLKDVYGITKCGEIAAQEERLGFSLSPESMDFFLSVAYGVMRLSGEVSTTLLRKATRCKSAQIRRESQYGRLVSDEQFIETVLAIFDNVYKDLVAYDFVAGRVSLDTRRTVPRVFWVTEEYEDISSRTNERETLREVTLRLAKRFAPRRTKETLDAYILSIHFGDIRTWAEEHEGATLSNGKTRRGPSRKGRTPISPEEKKKNMRSCSPLAQRDDASKPRGIMIVM